MKTETIGWSFELHSLRVITHHNNWQDLFLSFRQIAVSGQDYGACWLKDKLHGTSHVPTKLLSYVWSHWDHPVEVSQRTQCIVQYTINLVVL